MKSDWRIDVRDRAERACAVLEEHHGLAYVQGNLPTKCAKMWAFYSTARGEPIKSARALSEFAYARVLDTVPLSELAPSLAAEQLKQHGATGPIEEVVERFMSVVGDATGLGCLTAEAGAINQALLTSSRRSRNAEEQRRLNNAADVWHRARWLLGELESVLYALPVVGALLPPVRVQLAPFPLLGLSHQARVRALNADLVRLEQAGVAEGQLAQVWYGTDCQQNRKKLRQRLNDIAAAAEES